MSKFKVTTTSSHDPEGSTSLLLLRVTRFSFQCPFKHQFLTTFFQYCQLILYSSTHLEAVNYSSHHGGITGNVPFFRQFINVDALLICPSEQFLLHVLMLSHLRHASTARAKSGASRPKRSSFTMIEDHKRGVVFRSGKHSGEKDPGLRWGFPVFNEVRNVDMRTRTIQIPSREPMTIHVDAAASYKGWRSFKRTLQY